MDTSALICIRRKTGPHSRLAFDRIKALADGGEAVLPKEAYDELAEHDQEIRTWAKPLQAKFIVDVDLACLRRVLAAVPEVQDSLRSPRDGPEEADPYVIALALQLIALGHETAVITDDWSDAPHKASIMAACGVLRVPAMSASRFLINELRLFEATRFATGGATSSPELRPRAT